VEAAGDWERYGKGKTAFVEDVLSVTRGKLKTASS
jgi:hypothetical protein